jgi:hypothetical protein
MDAIIVVATSKFGGNALAQTVSEDSKVRLLTGNEVMGFLETGMHYPKS